MTPCRTRPRKSKFKVNNANLKFEAFCGDFKTVFEFEKAHLKTLNY